MTLLLTDGNIRNCHFCVRGIEGIMQRDVIGGTNTEACAPSNIIVRFVLGQTVEADVAGGEMFLGNRAVVGAFFYRIAAKEGDRMVMEYDGRSAWRIFKAPD